MYRKEGEVLSLHETIPFLEGWEFLAFGKEETVEKGKYKTILSRPIKGWLYGLDFVTDDAYAVIRIIYLGIVGLYTPHVIFCLGATEPPPSGLYGPLYIRPSTLSSAGVYAGSLVTSAYPLPVKGMVRLELGLENDTTQSTAKNRVSFSAIEIVDDKAFIRSYRKFKYGWLGWAFGVLSHIPGLKYIGIPNEIKEVVEVD